MNNQNTYNNINNNKFNNTNFLSDNYKQNIINNFTIPSLHNASSKLGKVIEMKEIEERLQKTTNNLVTYYKKSSLKNLKSQIRNLKKYELKLNSIISNKSNINRIHSNHILSNLQNQIAISKEKSVTSDNLNIISHSKSNNKFVSIFTLISNKENLNKQKGIGKGMSLPLVFIPNVSPELGKKGILDLKLNSVKRYINVFSKFNSEIATFQNIDYKFSSSHNHSIKNINTILEYLFRKFFALISKPYFDISASTVGLRIFYLLVEPKPTDNKINKARNKKQNKINKGTGNFVKDLFRRGESFKFKQLELLGNLLIKIFNKPVDFEITKLVKPYNDSTILSKSLGMLSNSIKYKTILYKFLKKANFKNPKKMFGKTENKSLAGLAKGNTFPSLLTGIKVRVGGRLLTQSVIPRRTVSIFQRGCLARGKADFVNTARFTNKNKRGSYSITVSVASVSSV
jgi:hypothetical protein